MQMYDKKDILAIEQSMLLDNEIKKLSKRNRNNLVFFKNL